MSDATRRSNGLRSAQNRPRSSAGDGPGVTEWRVRSLRYRRTEQLWLPVAASSAPGGGGALIRNDWHAARQVGGGGPNGRFARSGAPRDRFLGRTE
jgi:hypothetical protein